MPTTDRAAVGEMLTGLAGNIDVIVPRGGKSLVARVQKEARVPVFAHLEGICHVYVDRSADLDMAVRDRRQRQDAAHRRLRRGRDAAGRPRSARRRICVPLLEALRQGRLRDPRRPTTVRAVFPSAVAATEEDWTTEYLDAIISVKLVDGVDEAIDHIETYWLAPHRGDRHRGRRRRSSASSTRSTSAILLHNASTQFADGGEFGMGAEIGIATGKMHARGPVGVEQLTIFKYRVRGSGQIRP